MSDSGEFFESPGQFEYDGIIYTVGFPVRILDLIREGGFQTDEEDVFISSYPKAGRKRYNLLVRWVEVEQRGVPY